MAFKSSSLLYLTLFLSISSSIHALDITKLLGQQPEFATFSKYLTETKLTDDINKRNTITILAVDDGAVSALSGKSQQVIKATLSTHVILDYFDEKKLVEAQGSGQLLTTLYQSSGLAVNQQGFIKVALVGEGELAFGSAVKDAPIDVKLMKTVVTQPYNISILQVTKLITIPGVDSQTPGAPSNAQAPSAQSAKAPVASPKAPAPTQSAKADAPTEAAQTPSEEVTAPSPSDASAADSPADAPTTTASSPSLAPGPADGEAADAATPSSSSKSMISLVGAMMCFASLLVAM